jgi:site-specific DNA recombinase
MKPAKRTTNQAVGYCRVSTIEQTNGISLDAQQARIRSYCESKGLELVEIVIEGGVSASKPLDERCGGCKVLEAIRQGVGHVVALKLDRLFRNTIDCLTVVKRWEKAGVTLHLINHGGASIDTSSALGVMFLTMAAGFAEMERTMASERTAFGLARKRERGEKTGGDVPYGFKAVGRDVKRLVVDEGEQAIIQAAHELKEQGLSLRAIGAALAERGMLPRSGHAWHPESVSNLLKAWQDWQKRVMDWEQEG